MGAEWPGDVTAIFLKGSLSADDVANVLPLMSGDELDRLSRSQSPSEVLTSELIA